MSPRRRAEAPEDERRQINARGVGEKRRVIEEDSPVSQG
jgi:hypothetical protein